MDVVAAVCLLFSREELCHLGSLPENKAPLKTVDWENDISLKWVDAGIASGKLHSIERIVYKACTMPPCFFS
jgi:hypothetical protein